MRTYKIILIVLIFAIFTTATFAGIGSRDKATKEVPEETEEKTAPIITIPVKKSAKPAPSYSKFSAFRSIGSIIFVLGLLLALNTYLKRKHGCVVKSGNERTLKVIEKLPIDHRKHLLLIEAEGEKILVGVSQDRFDSLAVLNNNSAPKINETQVAANETVSK